MAPKCWSSSANLLAPPPTRTHVATPLGRLTVTSLAPPSKRMETLPEGSASSNSTLLTPPLAENESSRSPLRSASNLDKPPSNPISQGIEPFSSTSAPFLRQSKGCKVQGYSMATAPPSTRTLGSGPSKRARYRSAVEGSVWTVTLDAPLRNRRRPSLTEPSGAEDSLLFGWSIGVSFMLFSLSSLCLVAIGKLARDPRYREATAAGACTGRGHGMLLVRRSLVQAENLPQQVREGRNEERNPVSHNSETCVLERGEAPLPIATNGDEGLDRVALRRGDGLAAHNGASDRMHQGDVGTQEPDVFDPSHEPRTLQPRIEEFLVERGDLRSSFEVRAVEGDEIPVLRKDRGEGLTAAPVPAVHQLPIQVADGFLIGHAVHGGLFVVHGHGPF